MLCFDEQAALGSIPKLSRALSWDVSCAMLDLGETLAAPFDKRNRFPGRTSLPEAIVDHSLSVLAMTIADICRNDARSMAALAPPVSQLALSYSGAQGADSPVPTCIKPDMSFPLRGIYLGDSNERVVPLMAEFKTMCVDNVGDVTSSCKGEQALFDAGILQAVRYMARLLLAKLDCLPATQKLPRLETWCAIVSNGRTLCFARAVLTHDAFVVYVTPPAPLLNRPPIGAFARFLSEKRLEQCFTCTAGVLLWARVLAARPEHLLGAKVVKLLPPPLRTAWF